ncbi:MAG: PAS domain S-box protein [Bacteroidetes bacterium]|nr:MAG: PAS domain S-box protein [Bacteroidota bacterium]
MKETKNYEELLEELEDLKFQLKEANETLHAIRTGQIDALVVETEDGPQLYTLKSADHTYRVFIEKMKEGAVTLNRKGIILYSNSQFADMIDVPLAKVIGLPIIDFIPDQYKGKFKKMTEQGWESDSKGEIFLKSNSGKSIPFLLSFTSLELDEGTALSIILTDLTLQKENEKQLELKNQQLEAARLAAYKMNEELEDIVEERTKDLLISREYFKLLADNIPVIIWTATIDGKLDYVNRRWVEYTGFDVEESKTKQSELLHTDDVERSIAEWQTALKEKRKYEGEFRFKRAIDGTYRWHYSQAIPFKDEQGNITAWIGTNIDIDDQKKELEKKDEFIGVASHELKTPLTSLKGYIQLMEFQDNLSDEAKIYVTKATSSINKLQHLIDELLDASKIKAGKLKFKKHAFNLTQLVSLCVENSTYMYPSFKIKKELQEGIIAYGNDERIEQVLMNLINNAAKYSGDKKEIIIRAEKNNDSAMVSVIDFGIGMVNSDQELIFERFYRANGHESTMPGLGMGLYISSEIIKEHKGEIHVKSKLNEGSVFSFSLPLATQFAQTSDD